VRCVFMQGKLQSWTLDRPFQATDVEPVTQAATIELRQTACCAGSLK